MRSLALAEAWKDAGHDVRFVAARMPIEIEKRLRGDGFEVERLNVVTGTLEDAAYTASAAQRFLAGRIFLDGYQFGAEFQASLKNAMLSVAMMDDFGHATHYSADLVINQSVMAEERLYRNRASSTRLLLGTDYVLLRREFRRAGCTRVHPPAAKRLLITMGGSDPDNVTTRVLRALNAPGVTFDVIVLAGPANPHIDALNHFAATLPFPTKVLCNIMEMGNLLTWADMAVVAGGTTCYEAAMVSLPCLVLILAENQAAIVEKLGQLGAFINLGWHHAIASEALTEQVLSVAGSQRARRKLASRARRLVDGHGCQRVISAILTMSPLGTADPRCT